MTPTAASTAATRWWSAPAVGLVVAVVTVGRLLVTGPGLDRVWAEDGYIFLWDARRHGLASFGYSYAGYAHTLPRALGLLGAHLPLADFAAFAALATALVAGAIAALVLVLAGRVGVPGAWPFLPALAVGLAPAFRGSVGSLANLQWLLLVAALWCVLDRPGRGARGWLVALAALVAATTTPLVALLLPTALLVHRRGLLRSPGVAGLLVGLVVQAVIILAGPESATNPATRHPGFSTALSSALFSAVAGPNTSPWDLGRFGTVDQSTLLGALAAGLLLLVLVAPGPRRTLALAVTATGLLLYGLTSLLTGDPATRYAACAAMFLASALALAGPQSSVAVRRAVVVVLVVSATLGFPASQTRLSGPSWRDQVAGYEQTCARTGQSTPIELSPEGWGQIELRCG